MTAFDFNPETGPWELWACDTNTVTDVFAASGFTNMGEFEGQIDLAENLLAEQVRGHTLGRSTISQTAQGSDFILSGLMLEEAATGNTKEAIFNGEDAGGVLAAGEMVLPGTQTHRLIRSLFLINTRAPVSSIWVPRSVPNLEFQRNKQLGAQVLGVPLSRYCLPYRVGTSPVRPRHYYEYDASSVYTYGVTS